MSTHDSTISRSLFVPSNRLLGSVILGGSLLGALASAMLLIDRFAQLKAEAAGGTATFICDVSKLVSCGSVLQSPQAEVFGFPSPVFGIAAFGALAMFGLVLLTDFEPPRWLWLAVQAGAVFGIGFVLWLQYVSLILLGELCPWCMGVWAAMIPMFVMITTRVTAWAFLREWYVLVIAVWYVLVAAGAWFFVLL